MKPKMIIIIAGLITLCSWKMQQQKNIRKVDWLIGTWENKTAQGSIYEEWIKVTNSELAGKSYILKQENPVVLEEIRLVQEREQLFYIPTVKNQNGGLPVRFGLKNGSDSTLVFENAQHDFPQLIAYAKIGTDSLVAEISGVKNGRLRKVRFPMKRVQ